MSYRVRIVVAALSIVAFGTFNAACTESDEPVDQPDQFVFGGDRPVELRVPVAYDHAEPTPLLIVLHGYSAAGVVELVYARLDTLVDGRGVLVAAPDGTIDTSDNRFWNLTDQGVDDVAYINGLVDEISGVWNVDPNQVILFGHSNGSFLAYRMACEHADKYAAIVGLAGAMYIDEADCQPSQAVSVLHVHGDADDSILYDGDTGYASADDSTAYWANYNGCAATRTLSPDRLDLIGQVDGAETRVEQHDDCPAGGAVDLWTLEGGSHIPMILQAFPTHVWDWVQAHTKP